MSSWACWPGRCRTRSTTGSTAQQAPAKDSSGPPRASPTITTASSTMPPRTPGAALLPSVDNEEHAGVSTIRPNDSVDVRQETGCPTHRRRGGSSSSTRFPSRGAKFNDSICELPARQSMRTPSWPRRTSPTAQRSAQPALGSRPGSQGCRRGKTVLRAPWRRQQVAPRRERSASPRHRASRRAACPSRPGDN